MPTVQVPIPINGYTDSVNHQHGAEGFSMSMMNVVPSDSWEHRRRVGTRQGFAALADMGTSDDYNIQELLTYEVYRDTALVHEVLIVSGATGANSDTGVFYADSAGVTYDVEYRAVGATATVTFTGTVTAGKTIIITNTAGPPLTYHANATQTLSSRNFDCDGTVSAIATSLAACVNDTTDGHGNTITATASAGVVTLTQDVAGTATATGNTEITSDLDNATVTNFSGAAYANGTGRIQKYDSVRAVQVGNDVYLVTGRHYYKIDLSVTTPVIEEWTNYNGTGSLPEDTVGNKCSLITRFGGRVVMAGLSSSRNNWFMSKIGDPEDWTPTSGATGTHDAQAGDTSTNFGKLGEPITAIFPFGESGLMLAGRHTLTYLTADPVVSSAQFVRMSNGIGVLGPDAWCQGPEKTCYIASGDGVYIIQPNQFNIQRGQSVTTGRLDGFFSSVNPSEVNIHLAYDPPRSTIFMFVNRESDPDNLVHYQHHIPTQSWWTFQIADPRMDVIRASCYYTPIDGGREGLWYGCKSGRIATQPTSGILNHDGSAHVSPLKAVSDNDPNTDSVGTFTSRLAWSPINSGLSNERMMLTELNVLLDTHTMPTTFPTGAPVGLTASGPVITLYGAEMGQIMSGVSGDIGVTETRLIIDGGDVDDTISAIIDTGNADTKAYAIITVASGTAIDHGILEQQYITLTDNETTPVTKRYVVVDGSVTGAVATGTPMTTGADTGAGTLPEALSPAVAVNIDIASGTETAHEFLVQLKAAIEDSDGHNGKIVVSTVPTTGGGALSITLTQYTAFRGGNTPITETIASSVTIPTVFVGGQTIYPATGYLPSVEATISLHDSDIDNLHDKTMILNDLSSSTSAITLTFDKTLGVDASTGSKIGCADVDGNLVGIMKGIRKSIDLNYNAGLLNLKTSEPYLDTQSKMKIRTTDDWNGLDLLTTLTMTGTAVGSGGSNDIQNETFALASTTNWKQFITGGFAPRCGGTLASPTTATTYALQDVSASEQLRKWGLTNTYKVRKSGNTAATDPAQFEGRWGLFPDTDGVDPFYMADEATATISLSTISSTEVLPAGFTASTIIIDPQQDSTSKRELFVSGTLIAGRNNRLRVRKRESDFQVEISATGTVWILEDLAMNLEKGGPYRKVV